MVDFGDLRLFARPNLVPLSLVVFGATRAADEAAALSRISTPEFDSTREVVLEGDASSLSPRAAAQSVAPDVVSAERFAARVSLSQAGYLLQREVWYPGWRARVDGVETPVLRADALFRAVPLSAGDHDVEVFFDSASFKRGAFVTLGALVVIIILLAWRPIMRLRVQA